MHIGLNPSILASRASHPKRGSASETNVQEARKQGCEWMAVRDVVER